MFSTKLNFHSCVRDDTIQIFYKMKISVLCTPIDIINFLLNFYLVFAASASFGVKCRFAHYSRLLYNMKDSFGCMRKMLLFAKVPTADLFGTGRRNFCNKNCDSFFAKRKFSAAKIFLKYQSPTIQRFSSL